MSTALFGAVTACPVLKSSERRVLQVLADHANEAAQCHSTYRNLSYRTDMSIKTCQRAVKALDLLGVVMVSPGVGQKPNFYTLNEVWIETIARRVFTLKNDERAAGREPWEALETLRDATRADLYARGVPEDLLPRGWPVPDAGMIAAHFTPKGGAGGGVTGGVRGRAAAVENDASGDKMSTQTGGADDDRGDAGGDISDAGVDISSVSVDSRCPPNHIINQSKDARARPDGVDNHRAGETGEGGEEAADGPSPDDGGQAEPDRPAGWQPPRAGREASGEGTGKLDGAGGPTTMALEIATVHWAATGRWAPPSGRTLPIGPPPDDPDYWLTAKTSHFLRVLMDDEIRRAKAGAPSRSQVPQVRGGPGKLLRRALGGHEPNIDAGDVTARIATLERVLTAAMSADRTAPAVSAGGWS